MRNILFIEDDAFIRDIYEVKLHLDLKAKVIVAASGNEGIGLLKGEHSFDLVVSDYSMKDGTGLDVLSFLENNQFKIPFYLYTSTIGLEVDTKYPFYMGIIHKFQYNDLIKEAVTVLTNKKESFEV